MSAFAYGLTFSGAAGLAFFEVLQLGKPSTALRRLLFGLHVLLVAWLTVGLIETWVRLGHAPMSNMYETLLLLAWAMLAAGITARIATGSDALGAAATGLALACVIAAPYTGSADSALIPALRSNWLYLHVTSCILAYAFFALSAVTAGVYLIRAGTLQEEAALKIEDSAARLVALGFPFLTTGIVTGAIWARQAWGAYWSWDPKETWALVTWLIYAAYLHARFVKGWQGRRAAWLILGGFAAVLFTYFGVSYFLTGLHAYA